MKCKKKNPIKAFKRTASLPKSWESSCGSLAVGFQQGEAVGKNLNLAALWKTSTTRQTAIKDIKASRVGYVMYSKVIFVIAKCCRERAAARQYSPVSHGSDTERSALLRRAERAEALVQDRERLGKKSQQKETKQKIVLAGKTMGRPHKYWSALLRRAERAEALVQDRERLGKKSQQKETKQKIVLAGKTMGRPHKYWYSRLREQLSVGQSPGSDE
ncbi:UNVERIFIED_CONTAM: hypothetical protein FKN15_006975 [Acipenser sinensis]